MNVKKWIGPAIALLLILAPLTPATVNADEQRTIIDESVYDLLVDRFFNYSSDNDFDVDFEDPSAFNGGDFLGVVEKMQYIQDMGFTIVSLGPIFQTATYDGRQVLDYTKLDEHFGTPEHLNVLIDTAHKKEMKVMADFPLSGVSANHIWAGNEGWSVKADADTIDWNTANADVQAALIDAVVAFISDFKLDAIRFVATDEIEKDFLNELIAALKEVNPSIIVFGKGETGAKFDVATFETMEQTLRDAYREFDLDATKVSDLSSDIAAEETPSALFVDQIENSRFTYEIVNERMFPPTRWNMITTALLTLPGVPIVQYATEIAVNGEKAPETHPLYNFKTDEELKDHIGQVNALRNQSEALRRGKFEVLHNEDGWMVFKRYTDKEAWIIAINNTSKTQVLKIPAEQIGEGKVLRGLFENDRVRTNGDGDYRITLDREIAEMYIVEEDKGFNIPYLIAFILIYTVFMVFVIVVMRKSKRNKGK